MKITIVENLLPPSQESPGREFWSSAAPSEESLLPGSVITQFANVDDEWIDVATFRPPLTAPPFLEDVVREGQRASTFNSVSVTSDVATPEGTTTRIFLVPRDWIAYKVLLSLSSMLDNVRGDRHLWMKID
jgi:hypothetical protein